jgi:hypothetical protein
MRAVVNQRLTMVKAMVLQAWGMLFSSWIAMFALGFLPVLAAGHCYSNRLVAVVDFKQHACVIYMHKQH